MRPDCLGSDRPFPGGRAIARALVPPARLCYPRELQVLCLVTMGHPGESKPPHTKYDERKVHYGRY